MDFHHDDMYEITAEMVEVQPNGVRIEKTLDVVDQILSNPEICEEVKAKHGWPADMASDRVALLFLAARYQEAITLLYLRTDTLRKEVEAQNIRLAEVEFG